MEPKCQKLSFESSVELTTNSETKEISGFSIDAYTGTAVDRWWGKLVIDISGITAKAKMPVFLGHDYDKIVGHTKSFSKDGNFSVEGVFSKNTDDAKKVMALAQEDFPWQASIGVSPKAVMEISEGATLEVNGKMVKGPAEVWSKSVVNEVSFVPLGADSNTRVVVFSEIEKEGVMVPKIEKQEVKMDLETLKKEHPDLVAAIIQEAKQEELARIKAVKDQMVPGHEALIESLAYDGRTTGEMAALAVVKAEKEVRRVASETFEKSANQPVPPSGSTVETDPLKQKWEKSAELRAEFADDFELFKTYSNPPDGVRIK